MKYLFALVLLSGCTVTSIRDKNGVTRFRTGGDLTLFHYKDESTEISVSVIDHSTPTKAAAAGIANGLTAAAAGGLLVP